MKKFLIILFIFPLTFLSAQKLIPVAEGWAGNSVNAVVFRKNSVVTYKNIQFTAFYDAQGRLKLAKRRLGKPFSEIVTTPFTGNYKDAHNCISIMVDGAGYLHVSWDHHGHPLRYARSVAPLSLQLTEKMPMTGLNESNVTYPEFHKLPNGNLIFMYRDGRSGRGNLVMNLYSTKTREWKQLHASLIDGENRQNAYWQACVDARGVIHVSWVWRSSPDVASNHNMNYACSRDEGKTWEKSTGEKYQLPIKEAEAEVALLIPQKSELINQTSMTTDEAGNPFIASYWRSNDSSVPQYRIIYKSAGKWISQSLNNRTTDFSLSGVGTKSIPVARPQILVQGKGEKAIVSLLFRDRERDSKVSMGTCSNLKTGKWTVTDLTDFSVGDWEPSFDTELWKNKHQLNIFVQKVQQVDGEGLSKVNPERVYILEK